MPLPEIPKIHDGLDPKCVNGQLFFLGKASQRTLQLFLDRWSHPVHSS
jgi:hypothetical protein